jgi:peptidyl-prolyl cis-trans isomerase C
MEKNRIRDEGRKTLVFSLQKIILTLGCGIVLNGCFFSQERALLKSTVVTINGREVSTKEFADRLALRLKTFDALYVKDEGNLERAKEDTIRALLLETIIQDYAREHDI